MSEKKEINYKKIYKLFIILNRFLYLSIFLICLWIIIAPYVPEIIYKFKKPESVEIKNNLELLTGEMSGLNNISVSKNIEEQILGEDNIYIPSIDLVSRIYTFDSIDNFHKDTWLRDNGDNPEVGGNTVIIGHRYTRHNGISSPNTFYHLPKVSIGDKVYVSYKHNLYEYEIQQSKVVEPEETNIEDSLDHSENIITLYTCTPIWSSTNRFVLKGKLINKKDFTNKDQNNTEKDNIKNVSTSTATSTLKIKTKK